MTIQLHNIPSQPTPFIGREPEITEIVELLRDEQCRLLTLLGAGGMGKTRLSIEAVKQLSTNDFEHGVYYVPLAPLTSADNIVTTVISVLGIMIGNDGTPQEELIKFLQGRNLILVMDNFEHVLDGADLVADILAQTENIKILTTSREPLNLLEEQLWHVRGMRIPDETTTNDIDQYSGLKLFISRAQRVQHDFDVEKNLSEAIEICQLVGGMPLGIELAASWLKTLSCAEIIKQIERGIDFLSTRARDIPERHRSIRAVFDYSWDLLTKDEQAVFPRLSVFKGGFTLEAAEAVADADLMSLSGLVEKSMVRRDGNGRYDVHELLRQYADEKLNDSGEVDETLSAHMDYFADFMAEHAIDIKGRQQLEGLNAIQADWINIQSVWNNAVERIEYTVLDLMMEGLALYCDMHARYQEGYDLFQFAVETTALDGESSNHQVWNRLRTRLAQISVLPERNPKLVQELVTPSLITAKSLGDNHTVALCTWTLGESYRMLQLDFSEAMIQFEEALLLYEKLGDKYYVGRVLRSMVYSYRHINDDIHLWSELNQKHLEWTQNFGDITGSAHALSYLSMQQHRLGKLTNGDRIQEQAGEIWEIYGDSKSLATVRMAQMYRDLWLGNFLSAHQIAKQMLHQVGFRTTNIDQNAQTVLGFLATIQGDYEHGKQLAHIGLGHQLTVANHTAWRTLCLASFGLGDIDQASLYVRQGLRIQIEQYNNRDANQWLPIISLIVTQQGNHELAVELLGLTFNHPDSFTGWMEEWNQINELQDKLRGSIGDEAYQTLWKQGAQRGLKETIYELFDYFDDEDSIPMPSHHPLAEPLTERELEVLTLIAVGLTNPQIGEKLYLSTGTVKVHTRNIYGKLAVKNRTEAATKARELGLI